MVGGNDMTTFYIHNISSSRSQTIENICNFLMLKFTVHTTSVEADLLTYEIEIDHLNIVPFAIRFFHRIDSCEYERIEII